MGYMFVLPERDAHGRRVIFSKGAVFDSSRFTTSDMVRAHIMTFETLLNDEENQIKGFTYVLDEKAVGFRHGGLPVTGFRSIGSEQLIRCLFKLQYILQ
jgi:hypothetical protein